MSLKVYAPCKTLIVFRWQRSTVLPIWLLYSPIPSSLLFSGRSLSSSFSHLVRSDCQWQQILKLDWILSTYSTLYSIGKSSLILILISFRHDNIGCLTHLGYSLDVSDLQLTVEKCSRADQMFIRKHTNHLLTTLYKWVRREEGREGRKSLVDVYKRRAKGLN